MKSNVIPFTGARRSREEIRDQACAWLARLDKGATDHDLAELSDWLAEDTRHGRMLLNMAAMWDRALVLSELAEVFPLETKAAPARRRLLVAAAASLATAAVLGGVWFAQREAEAPAVAEIFSESFETAVGERRRVDLPDGSDIVLNTDTRLDVRYDGDQRRVVLERGEGYFNVASDSARPFRVVVGSRVVEAVGTAFTVQHTARKELEILVTEGTVRYLEPAPTGAQPGSGGSGAGRVTPLVAGERVTLVQAEQPAEKVQLAPEEVEMKLAWRVGMLAFQGDSLESVLEEVSRYTTIRLQADESIRAIQVDGVFRAGDIDALLVAMERNFRIASRRVGEDEILLLPQRQEGE